MFNDELRLIKLAQKMYSDYGDSSSWKNYQDKPMPTWEELPQRIRDHWLAVATNNDPLQTKASDFSDLL